MTRSSSPEAGHLFLYQHNVLVLSWKSGRVDYCTGLENRRVARLREFESHLFRHSFSPNFTTPTMKKLFSVRFILVLLSTVLLSVVFIFGNVGCSERSNRPLSHTYTQKNLVNPPPELEGCHKFKIEEIDGFSERDFLVIRCPNSTTLNSYIVSGGKSTTRKNVIVYDGPIQE